MGTNVRQHAIRFVVAFLAISFSAAAAGKSEETLTPE